MEPDIGHVGLYSIADAARYARLPNATVRRWLQREGRGRAWREHLVAFDELISLLFVREFRHHGVTLRDAIIAENDLHERFGWNHPFVHQGLWTSAGDVLVRVADPDAFVAANKGGQVALQFAELKGVQLPELAGDIHEQLIYHTELVVAWRPSDGILAHPATQFGLTCIEGTRIPTRSIRDAVTAGDPPARLAVLFGLPETQIQRAADWEQKLAA